MWVQLLPRVPFDSHGDLAALGRRRSLMAGHPGIRSPKSAIAWGCGVRAASWSFKPRVPVRVRTSLPLPPPNALADEQRSFKPPKQVRYLTGAPSGKSAIAWGRGVRAASWFLEPRIPVRVRASLPFDSLELAHGGPFALEALADEQRPLKPRNQARYLTRAPDFFPRAASPRPPPPVRRSGSRGLSGPRQFNIRGSVAQSADAAASRAAPLEVQVLPEPPIIRVRGGTSRHVRLRSGCPPGMEVQILPGPPDITAGGQAQSPRVSHKHASSVRLGVPLPILPSGSSNSRMPRSHRGDGGAIPSPGTRSWWNRQTHPVEGRTPQGMEVRLLSTAPFDSRRGRFAPAWARSWRANNGDMGRQRPTCFGNRHRPSASLGSPTKNHCGLGLWISD